MRSIVWGLRDVILLAALCPNTDPTGVDHRGYFADVTDDSFATVIDVYTNNTTTYYQSIGLWLPYVPPSYPDVPSQFASTGCFYNAAGFQYRYAFVCAMFNTQLREGADSTTMLTNYAKYTSHIAGNMGYWFLYSDFTQLVRTNDIDDGNVGWPPIATDAEYAVQGDFIAGPTWNGALGAGLRWQSPLAYTAFVPHDGDRVWLPSANLVTGPSNYLTDTTYYVINSSVSGTTMRWDLTTVLGSSGNIVVPTGSGVVSGKIPQLMYAPTVDVPPAIGAVGANAGGVDGDAGTVRYMANMLQHIGIASPGGSPTQAQIAADALARINPTGSNGYQITPQWAVVP
jgi:hypothetical protein